MRINVYKEEITEEVEIVWVEPRPGKKYCGVRFILASSGKLHNTPEDDDRSAVTFWLGTTKEAREFFRRALKKID